MDLIGLDTAIGQYCKLVRWLKNRIYFSRFALSKSLCQSLRSGLSTWRSPMYSPFLIISLVLSRDGNNSSLPFFISVATPTQHRIVSPCFVLASWSVTETDVKFFHPECVSERPQARFA